MTITVRRLMAIVAAIALCGFLLDRFVCGPTHYAAGFSEAKFASLREGMTTAKVQSILGPPLEKVEQGDGTVLWTYSDREDSTCSFEMRWVYFRGDKAETIVNMYWYD